MQKVYFLLSAGFTAFFGMAQVLPNFIAPSIIPSLQIVCTLLTDRFHFSAASLRLENRKSSLENLKQYYIDNLYYTKYNIGIRTVLKRKQHRKERLDGI